MSVSSHSDTTPNQKRAKTSTGRKRPQVDQLAQPEQVEVVLGRVAPFTQLGNWVALADIAPQAKTLYWALAMHVNVGRDDTDVWPSKHTLAVDILGYSRGDKIDPYLTQLEELGAIEVHRRRTIGGMRARNLYVVHETPPEGYTGFTSLRDLYNHKKRDLDRFPQVEPVHPCEGVRYTPTGDLGTPPQGCRTRRRGTNTKYQSHEALPRRTAGNAQPAASRTQQRVRDAGADAPRSPAPPVGARPQRRRDAGPCSG